MRIAKVVLGLPVEGPFDYIIPREFAGKIEPGMRARVSFGNKKSIAYIVGLAAASGIRNLKPLAELVDSRPLLNGRLLRLAGELSAYYCCSLGEAIETLLPDKLRGPALLPDDKTALPARQAPVTGEKKSGTLLIQDLDGEARWGIYLAEIKAALDNNRQVILLFPDLNSAAKAKEALDSRLKSNSVLFHRNQPNELEEWSKARAGDYDLILGTRSAVFAPLSNLGLIIIDEEHEQNYKQEQAPHYHAREAAFMRARIENCRLVLGSASPSLESFYLAKEGKIGYTLIPKKGQYPLVEAIDERNLSFKDRKKTLIFTRYLEECILAALGASGKILLFLNRRGFATAAVCNNCAKPIRCPRCNMNLVFHFEQNSLACHYCNFKSEAPKICPHCQAGYIRYSGTGVEKAESELSRIFPQARIKKLESGSSLNIEEADIFIATQAIMKQGRLNFDLVGVLALDNTLNRVDLRSGEKAFSLLINLTRFTEKKMVIQTALTKHYVFESVIKGDSSIFYNKELTLRKDLKFPPFAHTALIKLRGKDEERVKKTSQLLFEQLEKKQNREVRVISAAPGHPLKLRDNFHWQILAVSKNALRLSAFLKRNLKNLRHSGIIVTVDIDPL